MQAKRNFLTAIIGVICTVCLAIGFVFAPKTNKAFALSISGQEGVTMNRGDSVEIPSVENWSTKTVVFDVKTSEKTQFQLRADNGGTGIIRTKPDRTPETADLSSVENVTHEPYWLQNNQTPVALQDGWYRWVIDLAKLWKGELGGTETLNKIKLLEGSNVQVRNFVVYDSYYYIAYNTTVTLDTKTQIENWAEQTVQFDMNLSDGIARRFFLRSASGDVSGLIRCTPTTLQIENPTGSPYWLNKTAPENLGNGWYRFTVDLSEIKKTNESVTGKETIERIKNLSDKGTSGEEYGIELRNLKLYYDPMQEEGATLWTASSNGTVKSTIPDVENWGSSAISFEVYHPSLDMGVDPQFLFCEKETGENTTSFFGYKSIGGETALWLRTSKTTGYWEKSSTQPEDIGNGWFRWTIDMSELGGDGDRGATLGKVWNRGSQDVVIKNFTVVSTYNPLDEEGVSIWGASKKGTERAEIPDVPYWQHTIVSFEVYHGSLDMSVDPQFMFSKKGTNENTTGFFGYKNIGGETALWLRTSKSTGYWAKSTTQPESVGNGWYRWTIDMSELGGDGDGTETLGRVWNRGEKDVYVKNFTVQSTPFVLIDTNEINVPYEEGTTLKLTASIVEADGTLEYVSSDDTVATVNQKGEITLKGIGSCEITVSVKNNEAVKSGVCKLNCVELKDYVTLGLQDLTGETKVAFPKVNTLSDQIPVYTYTPVSSDNPSVVVRFLMRMSYLEQNRQAITLWGADSNGLYDGTYGIWAVCWKGAYVFDMYGNNGEGGIFVNGLNTVALNSHNTKVKELKVNTDFYVEAGAIDLKELINNEQLTYFYLKVDGVTVWSTIGKAEASYRNPNVVFTGSKESRCTVSEVELVNVTMKLPTGDKVIQVANGLKLPVLPEPVVTDADKKFIGWKKDNGEFWDYDYDRVNGNMTLTPEITSAFHTVEFNLNYGENGIYDEKYVGDNMTMKAPYYNPERTGYRFKWWSVDRDGEEFDFDTPIASDTKLYAVWVKTYEVKFVYDGTSYLTVLYDEGSEVEDPGWGYTDNAKFGKWADRGMFALNKLANGKAPYYMLTEGGAMVDLDRTSVVVVEDTVIYIGFAEVETVKADGEKYSSESKWDYVSLRDLQDKSMAQDKYNFTKYDTATAVYVPSKNNTTDSVIFRGVLTLGDKFNGMNMNIGSIALRSSMNANMSLNIWLRTNEVYLRTSSNGEPLYLANAIFDSVQGLSEYLDSKNYLKTKTEIPVEFGVLAVMTAGFEQYDRVYFKIGDATVFDIILPKLGKVFKDPSFRVGFYTDSDTAANAALSVTGVYDSFTVEFKDAEGQTVANEATLKKYSFVTKPSYELPATEGKKFIGWYDLETKYLWDFAKDRLTKNTVLVATYGYQVTLNPNGGAFPDRAEHIMFDPYKQNVAEGGLIKFGTDPIRVDEVTGETFSFEGWMKADGTLWNPETDVVTGEMTLTAKWVLYVKVTYYIDDTTNVWETKTVKQGSFVGLPRFGTPDSEDAYGVEGYEFLGWYAYNEDGDFVKVDLTTLVANKDMQVFAVFSDEENEDNSGTSGSTKKKGCKGVIGESAILLSAVTLLVAVAVVMPKKKENED